jgi:HSP20 family protein
MTLTRLNPRFPSLFRDFDDLFNGFTVPVAERDEEQSLAPAADITETDKAIEVVLDLPGTRPEEIDVKVEGKLLTISAARQGAKLDEGKTWVRRERAWGKFVRSFTLSDAIDGTKPEAAYKNGVLTVTLPKKEAEQPRSVKIKVEA